MGFEDCQIKAIFFLPHDLPTRDESPFQIILFWPITKIQKAYTCSPQTELRSKNRRNRLRIWNECKWARTDGRTTRSALALCSAVWTKMNEVRFDNKLTFRRISPSVRWISTFTPIRIASESMIFYHIRSKQTISTWNPIKIRVFGLPIWPRKTILFRHYALAYSKPRRRSNHYVTRVCDN